MGGQAADAVAEQLELDFAFDAMGAGDRSEGDPALAAVSCIRQSLGLFGRAFGGLFRRFASGLGRLGLR